MQDYLIEVHQFCDPILIAAVKATGNILAQKFLGDVKFWLHFLGVFNLIFFGLSILMFEYIIESE